ncbi:hypothetical protein SAMN05428975_1397 [Mucilaginibacter sp. OK268]|uniref:hypothetical protein n=1 Tax=Mucilaginibacter sp. OK268 TaxID=1881048 RepID=UPI00088454DA|nr:hypothetical protein [Mucilaginibacter sp. OK268]SDP48075.1 hypothetical protein SAMN05428975_1397 [Mucilaginibacter sp. OK268]
MNIKNYYTKAVMLVIALGLITAIQSCTKKSELPDASEDANLVGAWKRVIHRAPLGDSVQTVAFYEGQLSTLQTDVYATIAATSPTSTLYRATYNTNGTVLYVNLTQKLSSTDPNSSGTSISQVFFDKVPYKISTNLDTLTVTSGGTLKYIKVNQ